MLFYIPAFVGHAAAPWDMKSIDWVPTLNLGHKKFDAPPLSQKRVERASRSCQRRLVAQVYYYSIS